MRVLVLTLVCACVHAAPPRVGRDPGVRESLQVRMQPGGTAGLTQWEVEYSYSLFEEEGGCRVRNPRVFLTLQEILPAASASAEPSLLARLDVLTAHEEWHLFIDRTAAADLARALRSIGPQPTCAAATDAAQRAAARIIEECRARNDAFDAATDHGLRW